MDPPAPSRAADHRALRGAGQLCRDPARVRARCQLLLREGQRADGPHLLRPRCSPRRARDGPAGYLSLRTPRVRPDPTHREDGRAQCAVDAAASGAGVVSRPGLEARHGTRADPGGTVPNQRRPLDTALRAAAFTTPTTPL